MQAGLPKTLFLERQKVSMKIPKTVQKPTANHAPATRKGNENE